MIHEVQNSIYTLTALQDISLLNKKQDDTLEQVRKELSKQVRKRRASGSELFLQKSEALEFLQPRHRQKRSLSEECDEGCDFEEVEEVVESKSRVVSLTLLRDIKEKSFVIRIC